jgi:HEAT repeat protein
MKNDAAPLSQTTARKKALRIILENRDFDELIRWADKSRNSMRTLTSFLFDADPLICMRAVEALGRVAALHAEKDLEHIRKLVRRFFWMMNDESGNVGWYAPEAIGDILRNIPRLIQEYAPMLPSFLIEEPFEKGTRIAIARIAEIDKSPFNVPTRKKLIQTLKDPDPYIRATSIIALKALGIEDAGGRIRALADDNSPVELYDFTTGHLEVVTIAKLARNF